MWQYVSDDNVIMRFLGPWSPLPTVRSLRAILDVGNVECDRKSCVFPAGAHLQGFHRSFCPHCGEQRHVPYWMRRKWHIVTWWSNCCSSECQSKSSDDSIGDSRFKIYDYVSASKTCYALLCYRRGRHLGGLANATVEGEFPMSTVIANGTQAPELAMGAAVALGTCRTAFAMLTGVALLALLFGHAMRTWVAFTAETTYLAMRTAVANSTRVGNLAMLTCLALRAGLLQLAMRAWIANDTKAPYLAMGASMTFIARVAKLAMLTGIAVRAGLLSLPMRA